MSSNGLPIEVLRARIRRRIVERELYERAKLAQVRWVGSLVARILDGFALTFAFWGFWVLIALPKTESVHIQLSWLVALTCLAVVASRLVGYFTGEGYRVRP